MKPIRQLLTKFAFIVGLCVFYTAPAAAEPANTEAAPAVAAPANPEAAAAVAAPANADVAPAVAKPVNAAEAALKKEADLKSDARTKDQVCTRCHDESETKPILSLYQTKHGVRADSRAPNCQSCHGESDKHLHGDPSVKGRASPDVVFGTRRGTSGDFETKEAILQNTACLACHRTDSKRSHWEGSTHQRENVACVSCHTIHNGGHDKVREKLTQADVCFTCHKEQRTLINKPSHHPIPEGKMACSDCHNPHGSVGPKLMKRDTVNDTCYTCHMEKRGPFAHNHEPVDDDCTNCHNPHGTTAESMLKMRAPFLCNTCHTPHGAVSPSLAGQSAAAPYASPMNSGVAITQGRACANCHSEVHGSNNPGLTNSQFLFR